MVGIAVGFKFFCRSASAFSISFMLLLRSYCAADCKMPGFVSVSRIFVPSACMASSFF